MPPNPPKNKKQSKTNKKNNPGCRSTASFTPAIKTVHSGLSNQSHEPPKKKKKKQTNTHTHPHISTQAAVNWTCIRDTKVIEGLPRSVMMQPRIARRAPVLRPVAV